MSPKWLSTLVRARQVQEDVARQKLADARLRYESAAARVDHENKRIDDLCSSAVDTEYTAPAFMAAAVALQSAASIHAAATFDHGQAGLTVDAHFGLVRDAAVARVAAERMQQRVEESERRHAAALAQRELDETAARRHRSAGSAAVEAS